MCCHPTKSFKMEKGSPQPKLGDACFRQMEIESPGLDQGLCNFGFGLAVTREGSTNSRVVG